jgi:hypothetical protein
MNTRRPLTHILAVVLLILFSVFGLITLFGTGAPPLPVALFAFIIDGVGGLIAAFGLWMLKRWGLWLSIVIAVLTILVAVPGLLLAPGTGKIVSAAIMVVNAVLLVLVTLPVTRKAVAAAGAPVTA